MRKRKGERRRGKGKEGKGRERKGREGEEGKWKGRRGGYKWMDEWDCVCHVRVS